MVGETTNVLTVTITLTMIMIMSATAETTALIAEPIAEKIAPYKNEKERSLHEINTRTTCDYCVPWGGVG